MSIRLPAPFELVLAGQEREQGSIYSKISSFLLVTCPLLVESISPWYFVFIINRRALVTIVPCYNILAYSVFLYATERIHGVIGLYEPCKLL